MDASHCIEHARLAQLYGRILFDKQSQALVQRDHVRLALMITMSLLGLGLLFISTTIAVVWVSLFAIGAFTFRAPVITTIASIHHDHVSSLLGTIRTAEIQKWHIISCIDNDGENCYHKVALFAETAAGVHQAAGAYHTDELRCNDIISEFSDFCRATGRPCAFTHTPDAKVA